MSHLVSIAIQIHDINALERAVQELGGTFVRNKTTYEWFGRSVGDYPLPAGFTQDMLGKCEHVIRAPGHSQGSYEIGVVRNPAAPGYTLLYDFWGPGAKLKSHYGDNLSRLTQRYGVCLAEAQARRKGLNTTRHSLPNGSLQVKIHIRS